MTEARLPQFAREALEGEAGSSQGGSSEAGSPELRTPKLEAELEVERSLLSLERTLGAITTDAGAHAPPGDVQWAEDAFNRLLLRLDGTVGKAPYRYAPFFSRAAELFDLSEDAVMAELARLDDPKVWTFAGLPGIHHVSVRGGPRVKSAETLFVRFKPGVHFPRHHHTGLERVLVLEGSYEDSHGVQHLPGELREWPSGTEHSFKVHTGEPCIFASVVFGRRFHAWPLRALSKLLGK
jgi:hypothetical protein